MKEQVYVLGMGDIEGSSVSRACKSEKTARKIFKILLKMELKSMEIYQTKEYYSFYKDFYKTEKEIDKQIDSDIKEHKKNYDLLASITFDNFEGLDYIHGSPFWQKLELMP